MGLFGKSRIGLDDVTGFVWNSNAMPIERVDMLSPTIRGKRITVQTVLEFLGADETVDEILYQYPSLEKEDIAACLKFASSLMDRNFVIRSV